QDRDAVIRRARRVQLETGSSGVSDDAIGLRQAVSLDQHDLALTCDEYRPPETILGEAGELRVQPGAERADDPFPLERVRRRRRLRQGEQKREGGEEIEQNASLVDGKPVPATSAPSRTPSAP